jgi:hypothetical protein
MQTQTDAFLKSGEFVRKFHRLSDSDVTVADLELMRRFCTKAIANPEKARYRDRYQAQRKAINAELARRRKKLSDAA